MSYFINMERVRARFESIFINPGSSCRLFHEKVPSDDIMPFHHHPEWEISLIVRGGGYRQTGSVLEECREGEIILVPPEEPHCWMFDRAVYDYTENITVQFPDSLLDTLSLLPETEQSVNAFRGFRCSMEAEGQSYGRIRDLMERLAASEGLERLMALMGLIDAFGCPSSSRPIGDGLLNVTFRSSKRIQAVYGLVMENYSRKIYLSEAAAAASMSENAFCAFFRKAVGKTFSEFLCEFRIAQAEKMLAGSPSLRISDIALMCGFNDTPHFNRMFRRYRGYAPGEVRRHAFF